MSILITAEHPAPSATTTDPVEGARWWARSADFWTAYLAHCIRTGKHSEIEKALTGLRRCLQQVEDLTYQAEGGK